MVPGVSPLTDIDENKDRELFGFWFGAGEVIGEGPYSFISRNHPIELWAGDYAFRGKWGREGMTVGKKGISRDLRQEEQRGRGKSAAGG